MPNAKKKSDRITQIEPYVLGTTALATFLVAIGHTFGLIEKQGWLAEHLNAFTLILLSLVASYLLVERRRHIILHDEECNRAFTKIEESISSNTATIIKSLDGVEIRSFQNNVEALKYVAERLSNATLEILDLTWTPHHSRDEQLPDKQSAEETYQKAASNASQRIPYREVFVFSRKGRVEKMRKRLAEMAPGYSCSYYKPTEVPLLQFLIIDNEEVVFLGGVLPSKSAVRHPQVVALFQHYFEDIWQHATPLKNGNQVFQENINKALKTFEPKGA